MKAEKPPNPTVFESFFNSFGDTAKKLLSAGFIVAFVIIGINLAIDATSENRKQEALGVTYQQRLANLESYSVTMKDYIDLKISDSELELKAKIFDDLKSHTEADNQRFTLVYESMKAQLGDINVRMFNVEKELNLLKVEVQKMNRAQSLNGMNSIPFYLDLTVQSSKVNEYNGKQ